MCTKNSLLNFFNKFFFLPTNPLNRKFAYTFGSNYRDTHISFNLDISSFK